MNKLLENTNGIMSEADLRPQLVAQSWQQLKTELECAALEFNILYDTENPAIDALINNDVTFDADIKSVAYLITAMNRFPTRAEALLKKALATEQRFFKLIYPDDQFGLTLDDIVSTYLPQYRQKIKHTFLSFVQGDETLFGRYIKNCWQVASFFKLFNEEDERTTQFKFALRLFGCIERFSFISNSGSDHSRLQLSSVIRSCRNITILVGQNNWSSLAKQDVTNLPLNHAYLCLAHVNAHIGLITAKLKNCPSLTEEGRVNCELTQQALIKLKSTLTQLAPPAPTLQSLCFDYLIKKGLFSAQPIPISDIDDNFRQHAPISPMTLTS